MELGVWWLKPYVVFAVDLSSTLSTHISGVVMSNSSPSAGETKAGRYAGALWLASLAYLVGFSPVRNPFSDKGGLCLETIYPRLWRPHTCPYLWIMYTPTCTYTCNPIHEHSLYEPHICVHSCMFTCTHMHAYPCMRIIFFNVQGVDIGSGKQEERSGQGRDW